MTGRDERRGSFLAELERRNVLRTAAWYVGLGLVALIVAGHMRDSMLIGEDAHRVLVFVLVLFLPITLVLAWNLERSPEGIRRRPPAGGSERHGRGTTASGPGGREPGGWVKPALVTALLLFLGFVAAVRYDVAGLRGWTETHLPALTALPLVGPGAVRPTELLYTVTEGGADPAGEFTIVFSGRLDHRTVNRDQVELLRPDSSKVEVSIRILPDRRRVSIAPERELAFGTTYAIRLGDGLRAADGEPVRTGPAEAGVWRTLTTRPPPPDREPPSLARSRPEPGEEGFPVDSPFTVEFDEPVSVGTVNETSVRLADEDGQPVRLTVLCCSEMRKARVQPRRELAAQTRYALRFTPAIRDTAGNALRPDSVVFRTGREPRRGPPPPERTGPGILYLDVSPEEARRYVRIVVDGKELGTPPIGGHRVSPGTRHTVEVVGHPERSPRTLSLYRRQHSVGAGRSSRVAPEVSPFGSITVASEPVGRVYVDGEFVAETPLAGYPLPSGEHTITVRPTQDRAEEFGAVRRTILLGAWEWNQRIQVELPRR